MKKIKKFFAMILAMAMVMGLGMTSFAAESTTIVVNNLESGSTIKYLQIIEASNTSSTGWKFTADAENAFLKAFSVSEDQSIIQSLIDGNADTEKISSALDSLEESYFSNKNVDGNKITVDLPGVYAIIATPAQDDNNVIYARMTAYVGFAYKADGSSDNVSGETVNVYAKKSNVPFTKEATGAVNDNETTGIGEVNTYTITTAVPYGASAWKINDSISGGKYVVDNNNKLTLTITVGSENSVTKEVIPTTYNETDKTQSFSVNLSEFVSDSTYGATVVITYQAETTAEIVTNTASDPFNNSDNETLYTGTITFRKFAKDTENGLNGAGFKVQNSDGKWAIFDGSDGVYTLTGWVAEKNSATEVITATINDDVGKVVVKGLDNGTYYFAETTAPTGYSLNETPEVVSLKPLESEPKAIFTATGSMTDTTLSALPSTGGIGTTIFTIGGIVIMVGAAALFFVNRRKNNSK